MTPDIQPVMNLHDLTDFFIREFPQVNADGTHYTIAEISPGCAIMRLDPDDRHLRPGGTVSGPTLFTLADLAAYAVILAHIGPVALAVTTNLNINFLRKPELGSVDATARLLKLGKRLAVVEILMTQGDGDELVAHATATYSIPPRREN